MTKINTPSARPLLSPAVVAMALSVLAGCASTKLDDPASKVPVETRSPTASSAGQGGAGSAAVAPQSSVATVNLGSQAAGAAAMTLPSQKVVYFDYDSFVINDEYKPVIDGYGRVLSAQRGKKLVVEGHTDERGGREYNLALGQKRAEAVARSLKLLGATDAQIEAVSFGEERPAAQGADESAWAKNRRAELKDR
jgi:peptidoglycan-associated lipoprotein